MNDKYADDLCRGMIDEASGGNKMVFVAATKKKCTKCKIEKLLAEFCKRAASKDHLSYWCRTCKVKYQQSPVGKEGHDRGNARYRQTHAAEIIEYRQAPAYKETQSRNSANYSEKFPERIKAVQILNHAVATGEIIRPLICESCNEKKFVEGHHPDYDKPLEVDWLCVLCHRKLHKELSK